MCVTNPMCKKKILCNDPSLSFKSEQVMMANRCDCLFSVRVMR